MINPFLHFRKYILLFMAVIMNYSSFPQDQKVIDSLTNCLKTENSDTGKIKIYFHLGDAYQSELPDTALLYLNKALSAASELPDTSNKFTAGALNRMGIVYYAKGDYEKAIDAFVRSINIYEKLNDLKGVGSCDLNIGLIYNDQNSWEKALDYYNRSLKIFKSLGDKKDMSACLNDIGIVYMDQGEYDEAIENISASLKIREALGDQKGMSKCYTNIGNVYSWKKNYTKALEYYQKSLKIKESLEDNNGVATVLVNISEMNILIGNYNEAIIDANKSLEIGQSVKSLMLQRDNYENLSIAYDSLRDYKSAFKYHVLFKQAYDSIFNTESNDKIAEMQAKYESEKKQRDIEKLQSEKESQELKLEQSRIIIAFVIAACIFLLVLGLSLLNLYRQKQSKRKVLTTVVETEERERKRFAEDLHDGLGPLLSSVSLYVNELRSEKHGPEKKEEFFKMANELIDESIKNTRMIANNLMPGILNDYGLINALEAFCGKLKNTGAIGVTVHSELKDKRYSAVVEITLYRVILELINNTLKHAAASSIDIEIHEKDKFLNVSYSDDGKGFDLEATMNDPKKGLGLNNIVNRIRTIGGKCEFKSDLNKGILVLIEVNYKKFMA